MHVYMDITYNYLNLLIAGENIQQSNSFTRWMKKWQKFKVLAALYRNIPTSGRKQKEKIQKQLVKIEEVTPKIWARLL